MAVPAKGAIQTFTAIVPKPGSTVTYQGVPWYVMSVKAIWDESGELFEAHILPDDGEGNELPYPEGSPIWVNVEVLDGFGQTV